MEDTIVSISTVLGVGAISIIRVSGENAIKFVNKIYKGKNLLLVPTHTIHYGHIYDKDNMIDEVLVSVMKAPKTYTREDVVEINCHGGVITTNKVLKLLINEGARLAEPGEFTKRALLNGRIDLIEAEGVLDLINAQTEKAHKLAINQLKGKVSKVVRSLKARVLTLIAQIEVNIDYPEYEDIAELTAKDLKKEIIIIKEKITQLKEESQTNKIIKTGINVVILGRPNVGKSSIFNKLIEMDKAIVTEVAGTTRDIVEGVIKLDDILININDTAGIRSTKNVIEGIGIKKGLEVMEESDLIIVVLNNNEELNEEDLKLIKRIKHKKHIIFINKSDLAKKIDYSNLNSKNIVSGNTVTSKGLNELKSKIKELFNFEELNQSDYLFLTNVHQIAILDKILKIIKEIEFGINKEIELDLLQPDLREINKLLGKLIGEEYDDDLLEYLFSNFCLGK